MRHGAHGVSALPLVLALASLQGCGTRDTAPPEASSGDSAVGGSNPSIPAVESAHDDSRPISSFSVIAVGDLMMAKLAQSRIRKEGIEYPFARISSVLEAHDIAFANLEAPISDRGVMRGKKKFHFRVDPEIAGSLRHSGIDVVSLANNHTLDYGEQALIDTIDNLDAMGIAHSGAGADLARARAPARFAQGSSEVVFLCYCAWTLSGMQAGVNRAGVAPMIATDVERDVKALADEGKIVLVSLHWGRQHTDHATNGQVALAHAIIDAGAYAVLGHHTHRPAEIEDYRGKVIAYSLGNFLFGYYNPVYRDTFALVLEFEAGKLAGAHILPLVGRNARIHFQPRLLEGKDAKALFRTVDKLSARFGTRLTIESDRASILLGDD